MKRGTRLTIAMLMCTMLAAPLGFGARTEAAADLSTSGSATSDTNEKTKATFRKDLKLVDVDSDFLPKTPNVTFSYSIAAGVAGTETVGDDTITVKPGIGTPTVGSAMFTSADAPTGSNKYVSKNVEINFTGVNFTEAGVYRYVITETGYTKNADETYTYTADDIPAIDANNNKRTLDVYVDKDGDGFVIKGYVLYRKEDNTNTKSSGYTEELQPVYDENGKTEKPNPGDPDGTAVSVYRTYDVTLKKVVTGSKSNPNQAFTFTVNVPNQKDKSYDYHKNGGAKEGTITTATQSLTLKHNETYTIKGFPMSSKVTFEENDYTNLGYAAPTYTVDDVAGVFSKVNSKYKTADVAANAGASDPTDVVVTNHRENTPPTGILLSIAPFIAMLILAAGLGFLFFARKKRA